MLTLPRLPGCEAGSLTLPHICTHTTKVPFQREHEDAKRTVQSFSTIFVAYYIVSLRCIPDLVTMETTRQRELHKHAAVCKANVFRSFTHLKMSVFFLFSLKPEGSMISK